MQSEDIHRPRNDYALTPERGPLPAYGDLDAGEGEKPTIFDVSALAKTWRLSSTAEREENKSDILLYSTKQKVELLTIVNA